MPTDIKVRCYMFKELQAGVKAKEISQHSLNRAESKLIEFITDDWQEMGVEYYIDMWNSALAQAGFTDSKIHYSGFGSQGDGASFTSRIDLQRILAFWQAKLKPKDCVDGLKTKLYGYDEDFRAWLLFKTEYKQPPKKTSNAWRKLIKDAPNGMFQVERNSSHYSHEYTCRVAYNEQADYSIDGRDEEWKSLRSELEEMRVKFSRGIYRCLERDYFDNYNRQDEYAEEHEMLFDKYGHLQRCGPVED